VDFSGFLDSDIVHKVGIILVAIELSRMIADCTQMAHCVITEEVSWDYRFLWT
jgi:hypothetical protein